MYFLPLFFTSLPNHHTCITSCRCAQQVGVHIVPGALATRLTQHFVRTWGLRPPCYVQSLTTRLALARSTSSVLSAMQPKELRDHTWHHNPARFIRFYCPSMCLPLHPLQLCSDEASDSAAAAAAAAACCRCRRVMGSPRAPAGAAAGLEPPRHAHLEQPAAAVCIFC